MLSTRHISRFTGDKSSAKLALPLSATQDLQELRFPGLRTRRNLGGTDLYNGTMGSYQIDPPAGGFAQGDTVLSLPEQDPTLTIGAVVVPSYVSAYAPGIFDVEVRYAGLTAWTNGIIIALSLLRSVSGATDLGQGVPGVFLRCPGFGTVVADAAFPRFRMLSYEPWKLLGSVQAGPMTDTMIGLFRIAVVPAVLFDENGNVP
jgi:hypothetical protein